MDFDRAYVNSAFIPGADSYPTNWLAEARSFREALGARAMLDVAYGPKQRNRLDLFLPTSVPVGLLVFVHGGYWLVFGRESWSHLAAGALARGWACAMPSYTLAPEARLGEMTVEVARAIEAAAALVSGPVVVTGHSAGGHLSARMGCADVAVGADIRRTVPISPLADLEPIMATKMNEKLRIDADQAAAESPARQSLRAGCAAHVWVGAQERPAFLWQARMLSEAWSCPWTVVPEKHHFNIIDDLANPGSPLVNACLG